MAVSATTSSGSASALGALSSTAGSSADSEQRFLKLLVTQLNNQDPLNPLDNAQLTSQLAQMSTVSGIEKLNTAFQSLLAQSGSSQVLQSASLIGRTVLVPGKELALAQGTNVPFAVEMPQGAGSVKVTVTNAAGDTVRSYDLGALPQGVKTLSWDGKADGGALVADGSYTVNVVAMSGDSRVTATALTYANVASVSQGSAGVSLDLGASRKASLGEVRLIL
ncbi:MAG: flagellar hook assembly protein FlgD [Polaromonas sp.]|uniref:flagellar hook assembly protein FlgD n=1 Tax=Polaromonas sp. TaxID=1869339 RepID=UPI00273148EB|nr:flagellar hook assembly protein FlgD [Polaromonas sp.]MDP2255276.1 flagellar hook assembly protein FlgD [Polaromonas sp.]